MEASAARGFGRMQQRAVQQKESSQGLQQSSQELEDSSAFSQQMEFPAMSSAFPESSKFYHRAVQEERKGSHNVIREITQENYSESEHETDNLNQITFMQSAGQGSSRRIIQHTESGEAIDGEIDQVMGRRTPAAAAVKTKKKQLSGAKASSTARGSTLLRQDMLFSADKILRATDPVSVDADYHDQSFDQVSMNSERLGSELNYTQGSESLNASRSSSQRRINQKSKTLTDYTLLMLNFIPATIIQQLCEIESSQSSSQQHSDKKLHASVKSLPSIERDQSLQIPLRCNVNSVVLVAEFTNFYNQEQELEFVNEKLYNEYLVKQSSLFLEIVSGCLAKFGGDLIQFMGYSFVACWPRSLQSQESCGEEGPASTHQQNENAFREKVIQKAAQCAIKAKREILKVLGSRVKVIFGICYGEFQILHMGGILKRIEFFASGYAYQQALSVMRSLRKLKVPEERSENKTIAITAETHAVLKDVNTLDFYVDKGDPSSSMQGKGPAQSSSLSKLTKHVANKLFDNVHSKLKEQEQQEQQRFEQAPNAEKQRQYVPQKDQFDERDIQRVQVQLKSYIPAALRHFAHVKEDRLLYAHGSHLKQTVAAIAIELNQDSLDCNTKHQLNLLQSFVEIIQMQVYLMEGSINKILAYEGGLIVLASWGSATLSHHDDAPRAIYAALNIKKELIKFQQDFMVEDDTFVEPPIHIGIATGDIFNGIVGRNQRKEIVSIGPAIERSFLLMQTALKHYGKVYVDQQTKMSANHFINFEFAEMLEFSHKILNETIYYVVDEDVGQTFQTSGGASKKKDGEQSNALLDKKRRSRTQAQKIMIHANPFFIDRDNSYQRKFSETYGRSEIIVNICDDIAEYIDKQEEKNVWVIAIRGSEGSGKSLFARRLLMETSYRENALLKPLMQKYDHNFHFEYVVCNCNSSQEKKFIGTWRPFLRHLLTIYSEHLRQSKEYTINSQIQFSNVEDKVDVIEAIFDLKNLARSKSQASFGMAKNASNLTTQSVNAFANSKGRTRQRQTTGQIGLAGERYDPDFEDAVILFCLDFILQALEALQPVCCFFVIVDNVSKMNVTSWKLFDLVSSQPNLLIMVMCIQTTQKYFESISHAGQVSQFQFLIAENQEEAKAYYQKYIKHRETEIFNIADMTPMSKASFKKALLDLAPVYERDINSTIEELTKILDTTTSEKKFTEQQKIATKLINVYQGYQHFKHIREEILDQIIEISQGNPLVAFWFTFQAMIGKFVQIKNFTLVPTAKFHTSQTLNDWVNLTLPWPLFKHNSMLVQNALSDSKFQQITTNKMQMTYLLQTAAVIGDVFSMRMLDTVNKNFLNQQSQQVMSTMGLLAELEQRDLIELLYDDNTLNDRFYRFTHPFTRSTIYQGMPWQWKVKEIHSKIIDYMKDRVIYDMTTGWSFSKEYMIMMRHVMNNEQIYSEAKLSQKAKQILIVKKINQQLAQNNKKSSILCSHVDISFESKDNDNQREKVSKWSNLFINLKMNCFEFFQPIGESQQSESNNFLNALGIPTTTLVPALEPQFVCIGFIPLAQIIKVKEGKKDERQDDVKKDSFIVKCNKWSRIDKSTVGDFAQHGKAEFVLTLNHNKPATESKKGSAEREAIEWVTAIEYLRAKSTFDSFVDSFGKVDFRAQNIMQQTTLMQRKEATNSSGVGNAGNKFSLAFQGQFQQRTQALNANRFVERANMQLLSEEGALEQRHQDGSSAKGSSGKFKRRQTLEAGQLLRSSTNNKVSADEMKGKRVKDLAKKLLIMYNVSSVSFYGHMQTCALKDSKVEDADMLGLGRLSAIDQTNIAQMSHRKSLILNRRKTMNGPGGNQVTNLQTQMQLLIRRHLPRPLASFAQSTENSPHVGKSGSGAASKSRLRFTRDDSDGSILTTSQTEDKLDTGLTTPRNNQDLKETVPEYDAFADQNVSQIYNTMSNFNAEKNLFTEERNAVIGRTRPGKFIPGQKVGLTRMYLQEKLDGDLANFKLQKRHDRIGYNQAMTPFIVIGSEDGLSACGSVHSGLHSTTPRQMAAVKSNGSFKTYNSAANQRTVKSGASSQRHLPQTPPVVSNGVTSIMSQQNGAKLPHKTRKAKGIAIQKILESTQKPWFMITGHEYHRPSPFGQKEEDKQSDQAAQISIYHSKNTSQSLRNYDSEQIEANHSFNREEESKDGLKVSDRSKTSISRELFGDDRGEDLKMKAMSKQSSQKSLTSLIKHETKRQSSSRVQTTEQNTAVDINMHTATASEKKYGSGSGQQRPDKQGSSGNQGSGNVAAARNSEDPTATTSVAAAAVFSSKRDGDSKKHHSKDKKEMGGTAAKILIDKTPFVVLKDEGRTQLTAEQVDFELNASDVIFVEKDLPEQEGNSVLLSQGYCLVRNKPVTIVLPRTAFKLVQDSHMHSSSNLNRITEETRSDQSHNFNSQQQQQSASQMLGVQPERKIAEVDSAERLLLQSPTELGIFPSYSSTNMPPQMHLAPQTAMTATTQMQYHHNQYQQRQNQTPQQHHQTPQHHQQKAMMEHQLIAPPTKNPSSKRPATTMASGNSNLLKVNQRKMRQVGVPVAPPSEQQQHQSPPQRNFQQLVQTPSSGNQPVLTKMERRRQQKELQNMQHDEEDGPAESFMLLATNPSRQPYGGSPISEELHSSISQGKGSGSQHNNQAAESTKPSGGGRGNNNQNYYLRTENDWN